MHSNSSILFTATDFCHLLLLLITDHIIISKIDAHKKKLNYPLFRTEHYHHHRRYCFVGSTFVQSYEFGPKLQQNFALQ